MPGFQDFGEVNLTGNGGHGYVRLDWFTPDALPTWGDGRSVSYTHLTLPTNREV